MARFELTIDPRYVPNWGVWEGIRELVQNALDGQDQGYPMRIFHKGGYLVVQNEGLRLDRQVLLLGNTTKQDDRRQRGQWGEGMKLGMLALLRAGIPVFIMNDRERWTPEIAYSETFGTELLSVTTRKQVKREYDFAVFIGISEEEWERFRPRFLDLREDLDFVGDTYGRILLGEEFKGQVYASGIYVKTYDDIQYGYDFKHLDLDRDRKMADEWDLRTKMESAWRTVIVHQAKTDTKKARRLARDAYDLLSSGDTVRDLSKLGDSLTYVYGEDKTAFVDLVAECFEEEYGKDARPVSTQSEVEKLEHAGLRATVVSRPLQSVLKHKYGDAEQMFSKAVKDISKCTPLEELDDKERLRLERAAKLLHLALPDISLLRLMERIKVVSFIDEDLEGLWSQFDDGSYEVKISRRMLGSVMDILKVLVHEFAHNWGGDGTKQHGHKIETLWSAIASSMLARTGYDWLDEV